jgi:predicted HAD superfamily Cof-like phosphohydrolase
MSNYEKVQQFTEEAWEIKCPEKPQLMSKKDVIFLISMILSETVELAETVTNSPKEAFELVQSCMGTDLHTTITDKNEPETICEQMDALVDIWYYSLNMAAKYGMNLSKVFDIVHDANMAKKDPITGSFIKRESDGKILKPLGWQSPDKTILFSFFPGLTDLLNSEEASKISFFPGLTDLLNSEEASKKEELFLKED